jgi:hypothetical protein
MGSLSARSRELTDPQVLEFDAHRWSRVHLQGDDPLGQRVLGLMVLDLTHPLAVDPEGDVPPLGQDAVFVPVVVMDRFQQLVRVGKGGHRSLAGRVDHDLLASACHQPAAMLVQEPGVVMIGVEVGLISPCIPVRSRLAAELNPELPLLAFDAVAAKHLEIRRLAPFPIQVVRPIARLLQACSPRQSLHPALPTNPAPPPSRSDPCH